MKTIDAEKLKQFLKESISDIPQNLPEMYWTKGWNWRSIITEKSVLASSSQILGLAAFGIMVNAENAKSLSTYLLEMEQLNYDIIPEQKSVGRLGWTGAYGFSPYVGRPYWNRSQVWWAGCSFYWQRRKRKTARRPRCKSAGRMRRLCV